MHLREVLESTLPKGGLQRVILIGLLMDVGLTRRGHDTTCWVYICVVQN
jgi:hypothetical protein